MTRTYVMVAASAALAAVVAAFATTPGSGGQFRFKVGQFDSEGEKREIAETLKLFSATYAGFYVSGGNPEGLRSFPAEMMIKRRIFMDINSYREAGLVFALDRDRSDIKEIRFADATHAAATADEFWFMQFQNAATRRPLSAKKANFVTVRYFLKKQWGKWIVLEYEVYGQGDELPPLETERIAAW